MERETEKEDVNDLEAFGYAIASGSKGTGWMKFTKDDLHSLISSARYKRSPDAAIQAQLDGWEETEQFAYEVGYLLPEFTQDEPDDYFDAINEWELGYTRYINEQITNKQSIKKTIEEIDRLKFQLITDRFNHKLGSFTSPVGSCIDDLISTINKSVKELKEYAR